MVVLEAGGMLGSASNQYLQPDYLSPLPTTLDAKKSPLALLAQTCSQIGADSPSSKALLPPIDKKKESRAAPSPAPIKERAERAERAARSPQDGAVKLAFKPYETQVLSNVRKDKEERPSSKTSVEERVPSRRATPPADKDSPPAECKSVSPRGASPVVRSGLDLLQGHPKDLPLGTYKPYKDLPLGLGALCSGCPPGLDPANPAFRPPFAGGLFSHQHAALLAGYSTPGPYVSYARVKTAGGEALVPVCKDPYCTGCQFSAHGSLPGMLGACPSGCTQCDHQKYGLAAAALGMLPPGLSTLPPYSQMGRPYVCSWMIGEAYCGKRFGTPDELLQHLRTHTSPGQTGPDTGAAVPPVPSLLSHSLYPPLSPLSSRYHPYSKPSLLSSPFSAFNPTALGPYYSPYSLYGQRLGAAVHP